ncbi:MAG: cyclase family protein [Phaeodactylibacter sp.]|nr:cyclase family protein [Phaeodactylibacter sp.]
MVTIFEYNSKKYSADLNYPLDISIPLIEGEQVVNCFYAPLYETSPVIAGDFVGSTAMGGPLNFLNVRLNPHGNGTHTECVGHIAKEHFTINQSLKRFHFAARLISMYPTKMDNGDRVIQKEQLEMLIPEGEWLEALVLRTFPNSSDKQTRSYSGNNPPYLEAAAVAFLVERGVQHLLLDLPSVDREEDGGALAAHKAFWRYPERVQERSTCTITELVYVAPNIPDGLYLLNIGIASFEIDVSPSKPVLYAVKSL